MTISSRYAMFMKITPHGGSVMKQMKSGSKYSIFSLIIIVVVGFFVQLSSNQSEDKHQATTEQGIISTEPEQATETTYTFRSKSYLDSHFEKHGGEFDDSFGYQTAADYEKVANRVINDPNSLHKIEAEDGDDIYYLEASNEFVVVATDGYIRTYFRPNDGINYYNRQ
ncbi:MAG: hypothetical protein Q4D54_06715 [Eubacteriales bacterium]|nr:hypothetical protein [Eubacteriales bacterium]